MYYYYITIIVVVVFCIYICKLHKLWENYTGPI